MSIPQIDSHERWRQSLVDHVLAEVEKLATRRPYRTEPHAMGLRTGYNLDNIQELLAQAEGAEFK